MPSRNEPYRVLNVCFLDESQAGQSRKTKKGPKHLPGRTYNIAQANKRAQKRLQADTKADAAEVASLKKY